MVSITSTGVSIETAKDAAGNTANDGLVYDDAANDLDVDVDNGLTITATGKVDIDTPTVQEQALAYDFVGVG